MTRFVQDQRTGLLLPNRRVQRGFFAMGPGFFKQPASAGGGVGVSPDAVAGFTYWLNSHNLATLFQDNAGTTAVTANGQPVGCINNAGAGATTDLQFITRDTSAGTYPTYDTVDDAFPTIKFDGVGNILKSIAAGYSDWNGVTPYLTIPNGTIICAAKLGLANRDIADSTGANARYAPALLGQSDSPNLIGIRWADSGSDAAVFGEQDNANTSSVTVTRDTWHIYSFKLTSTTIALRVDGDTWQTQTTAGTPSTGYDFRTGMGYGASAIGAMKLSDIATFSGTLADTDISDVEQFLANKVGVTL